MTGYLRCSAISPRLTAVRNSNLILEKTFIIIIIIIIIIIGSTALRGPWFSSEASAS
jgi:hypothetical protein